MDEKIQTTDIYKSQTVFPVCFVTYYPDQGFFERLQLVLDAGYKVIVYDNTDEPVLGFDKFVKENTLELFRDGHNAGLGEALKFLMGNAKQYDFTAALYFDQDTRFSLRSLRYISSWMDKFFDQHQDFAAIRFSTAEYQEACYLQAEEVRLLISSGCVFRLDALEQLGWHDDHFFVEGVDYKFCLDAHIACFRLGEVRQCPDIDHESLQPLEKSSVFGREIIYRRYPMQRHIRFVGALLRLSGIAMMHTELRYALIFFRNIFTHLIAQSWYFLLAFLFGSEQEDLKRDSQKVES